MPTQEPISPNLFFRSARCVRFYSPLSVILGSVAALDIGCRIFYLSQNQLFPGSGFQKMGSAAFLLFLQKDFFETAQGKVLLLAGLTVFLALGTVVRGLLVKAADSFDERRPLRFSIGQGNIRVLAALDIITSVFVGGLAVALLFPSILLFAGGSTLGGWVLLELGAVILLPVSVLAFFLRQYGRAYIVLSGTGLFQALENSYRLFRKHPRESLLAAYSLLLLRTGFLSLTGMLFLTAETTLSLAGTPILSIVLFGLIPILLAWYEAFSQTAWTLFFKKIARPSDDEKDLQKQKYMLKEDMAVGLDRI
jgi:hypothetical protein